MSCGAGNLIACLPYHSSYRIHRDGLVLARITSWYGLLQTQPYLTRHPISSPPRSAPRNVNNCLLRIKWQFYFWTVMCHPYPPVLRKIPSGRSTSTTC